MVTFFQVKIILMAIPILGTAAIAMRSEEVKHGFWHGQGAAQSMGAFLIFLNAALWYFLKDNGYWIGVILTWLIFIAGLKQGFK